MLNIIDSRKNIIFFAYTLLALVTENKIVFMIGYNFRPIFYTWSKEPKTTMLKIYAFYI